MTNAFKAALAQALLCGLAERIAFIHERIGTPAMTTRGLKEADMAQVAKLIGRALDSAANESELLKVRAEVKAMSQQFPLYASRLRKV